MLNPQAIRRDFPIFKQPLIYFDNAATTQKPLQVIDAITQFYSHEYGTVHRAVYALAAHATSQYNAVRSQVRSFINAQYDEEIIFTRGTTDAINLLARSFPLERGDEVIISEMEHHSNFLPWREICWEKGARLHIIPILDDGRLDLDRYADFLGDKTKIVSIAHVSNATGTHHPIREMIAQAHHVGAKVMVDGAQAAAHQPVDVQNLDADFYAFSSHKMYGPTGVGILYGKKALLEALKPYQFGGDMVDQVSLDHILYQKTPHKFEAGTPPIAQVIGLGAAIAYLQKLDLQDVHEHVSYLGAYFVKKLQEIEGVKILPSGGALSSLVSFVIEGIHPLDIGTMLGLKNIAIRTGSLCAQPAVERFGYKSVCRASFGIYNSVDEIETFTHQLRDVISCLKIDANAGCNSVK